MAEMQRSYESALNFVSLNSQISLSSFFPSSNKIRERFIDERCRIEKATYLSLGIRREVIVEDALNALVYREERELRKPLKVKFLESGEEGVDQGGPQYEFFAVLFRDLLRPERGLFQDIDSVNHVSWFTVAPLEVKQKFELVGMALGLAVYNGIAVPVNFPLAFYRFLGLKDEEVDTWWMDMTAEQAVEMIKDGWPDLARGLTELLTWPDDQGDVSDIFVRTYEFSYTTPRSPGVVRNIDMTLPFSNILPLYVRGEGTTTDAPDVTNGNRREYVVDYVSHLVFHSVYRQLSSLRRGFRRLIPHAEIVLPSLLPTPASLKLLVEGTPHISVSALRQITRYDDGYHPTHPLILEFWSEVEKFSPEELSQLLEFVTASDRVPTMGVESLTFVVQRNGGDTEMLPSAMTCFGRLLLPEYELGCGKVGGKVRRAVGEGRVGFGVI